MALRSNNFGEELSPASLAKLISFVFWGGLYLHTAFSWPKRSPEWCSRVITLLHGSVATAVGLSQCGMFNLTPFRLTMKITACHYALMVWSWGYFAFDLLWCLIYWSESVLMLCHHSSALVAITIYMQKEYTGCTFACTVAMLEITNPLLQTRWFLRDEGQDKTILFMVVEVLYLTLFLFVRAILGSYLTFKILESQLFDMEEKLISVVFYIVSMAFVYEIVGYVLYKYKSKFGALKDFLDDMRISDHI